MELIKQGENVDLSRPVLREPMETERLLQRFTDHLDKAFPVEERKKSTTMRVEYYEQLNAINLFEKYLKEKEILAVMPTEEGLFQFREWLMGQNRGEQYARDLTRHIRNFINNLPGSLLLRPLVDRKAYDKYHKMDFVTPETRDILREFERDGRRIKNGRLSTTRLAPTYRLEIVSTVLRILRKIQSNDLFRVTEEDAEEYLRLYEEGGGKRNTALAALFDARQLFANLLLKGRIENNPLEIYTTKPCEIDFDYISRKNMAMLEDLSTVDFNNFLDVRDRLITFGLFYDFALRLGTGIRLLTSDVTITDMVEIVLRPGVQKGIKGKRTLTHRISSTRTLFQRYLELRERIQGGSSSLLVSETGAPLLETGAGEAVKNQCNRLGIKTVEDNEPTCHRLRHTFGTLNISPIGLALSLEEIAYRLCHNSLDVTRNIYITYNPELERERGRVRAAEAKTGRQSTVPVAEKQGTSQPKMISENDAVARVGSLDVKRLALRAYALKDGHASKDEAGDYSYDERFIEELEKGCVSKTKAMKIKRYSNGGFFWWCQANGVRPLRIGRVSLYRLSDLNGTAERVA